MVAVEAKFRKRGIGKKLVVRSIEEMMNQGCDAVCLFLNYLLNRFFTVIFIPLIETATFFFVSIVKNRF